MEYRRDKIDNIFIYDTRVENIFISEYMAVAPGEYVKVYLLGLMYAESKQPVENRILASQLNMAPKDVASAWKYWADKGLVKIKSERGNSDEVISFVNIREKMFGFGIEEGQEEPAEAEGIQEVFNSIETKWGITLNGKEMEEIASWPDFFHVEISLIVKAVEYCSNKTNPNIRYMEKVVMGWSEKGLKTVEDAQRYLDENDQRYYCYRRIFKALGFNRNATEAERALMDSWFDEMKFAMDKILDACATTCGIGNPNLKYVDKVLRNWHNEGGPRTGNQEATPVGQATLNSYYSYLRDEADRKAKERLEEVYRNIPRAKDIDGEISRLGARMTSALVGGKIDDYQRLEKTMDKLMAERAILLTENNYEMDYTDIKYRCEICKDTGLTDEGEKCTCIKDRMEEARVWQK